MRFLDNIFRGKHDSKSVSDTSQHCESYIHCSPKHESFSKNTSVKIISQGAPFCLNIAEIQVFKQFYNHQSETIPISNSVTATIKRMTLDSEVEVCFNGLDELKSKGIIQGNLSMKPNFTYNSDTEGNEFASAEINNSFSAMASGKEYISLFQITQQKGKIISFIINNLPGDQDFYYLIVMHQA